MGRAGSEDRLREVIDFTANLKGRADAEERMRAQMGSFCYNDWLCSENDIYDDVFQKDRTGACVALKCNE